jgi:hypothetical protein
MIAFYFIMWVYFIGYLNNFRYFKEVFFFWWYLKLNSRYQPSRQVQYHLSHTLSHFALAFYRIKFNLYAQSGLDHNSPIFLFMLCSQDDWWVTTHPAFFFLKQVIEKQILSCLSHTSSPFCLVILEMESCELLAWADLKPWSSWSPPLE